MLVLLVFSAHVTWAQTTVFADDFSTSAGTTYTTATGPVGSSTKWNFSRSGSDFGTLINSGTLSVTNNASGSYNNTGWGLASTSTASFLGPFSNTLANNPGTVTWTFNMRQSRSNPSGFSSTGYGAAFILAGTTGTTNVAGTGYAITLGNSGTTDPIRLVRYTSGLRTATTLITSATSGLTDFGTQYLSIKVTYTPSTGTWQLFLRNDSTAFQDPSAGTLVSQGTAVSTTYATSPLGVLGGFWNGYYTSSSATFDNIKVTVAIPTISSISPASRIAGTGAFPLTVNGTNFVSGTSVVRWNGVARTTTYVNPTQLTAAIPASDIAVAGTALITVANGTAISNSQTFTIDAALVPSLAVSTTALAPQNTVTGTPSTALSYTISGTDLSADAIITAPANFEISTAAASGYVPSLTLARTGNTLTGQPVTIYSRIKGSASAGIYSGNITNSATGATTKSLSVSGTVMAAQPITHASGINFTLVTSASFTINWANGSGTNRVVAIRSANAVNAVPVDGVTYFAGTSFSTGSEIGTGNFVVYTGTGNSVNVTGLSPATTYHVAVYEYNGSAGIENYFTTSAPTGNRLTLNAPVGWQIFATNTINTIDFDTTVDGVNLDAFQGEGLSPTAHTGQLNSSAWAISGFSDGNIGFGNTSADESDFDRGTSEGSETDGGLYAFETAPANSSLGFQPATGDFAPGSATLRFQNQTGSAITSVSVGFKVYVHNDEAGATSINFSHSADNSAYNTIGGLATTTTATADVDPEWKAYYRVVTITGLNILNNNYYYLRWNATTASGTTFDEIAVDDIQLVANPSAVFASFSGTANDFVVQGNATLSGDTTVDGNLVFNSGKLSINGKTLTLAGPVTNTGTGGLKGSAASSVTVTGTASPTLSFDQTTGGTTNLLNNLNIATTTESTVTIANPVVINGTLSVNTNQTLNLGTNALTGTLTTILNNGTITTQNTSTLPIPANKSWNGTGTINLNASTAQTVVPGTYNNLTITNTAGAVASGSLTVNGILNLPVANPNATLGSLSTGSFTLTMGGNAVNSGIGDVTGIITRNTIIANTLYTFGHANTSIIFPASGTLPTTMSLKVAIGTAPSWRTGAVKRDYDFIQTGAVSTKAVIRAHYLDVELNSNSEAKLVDWANVIWAGQILEQGRSNFSSVENWVELTNVNVGLYFKSTFDQVKLTFDESESGSLTWNGSVSTSWTTAANWTPNATPSDATIVYIPDAATTANDPSLNPSVLLGSLTIEAGGILNAPNDSQFTIKGAGGAWLNNGTFNPGGGTSTVIFTNADATIAGTTNFNNLTVNTGASLRPVTNNYMRIAGSLVNNGSLLTGLLENTVEYTGTNQVIAVPNGGVGAYHNLIINGTGTVVPSNLSIHGNFTVNQSVNFSGTTLEMSGLELQTITGFVTPQFNNLVINNSFGRVNLSSNATVTGVLTLTAGNLNIGNSVLTLGTAPVAGTFDATHMIVASGTGEVRRPFSSAGTYLFPIGDATGTTQYSPLTVTVSSGTFAGAFVGVSVTDAIHPNNASLSNHISRYWKVNQTGISNAVATISATYLPVDVVGSENAITTAQLNGVFNVQTSPWVKFAPFANNTLTASTVTLTSGQPSYFTGIRGAAFTTQITGYGAFCQNQPVTLTATPSEGDAPYSYFWSNSLGTSMNATPPTSTAGTTTYTVTVKDNNGITSTDSASVVVLTPSLGGTPSADQYICTGTAPADIHLSGHNGNILYWQSSADASFTSPTNISNTTAILSGLEIGSLTSSAYFRAVIQNGACDQVYSAPVLVSIRSTTWNGTSWSNGTPNSTTTAVIAGNYTAAADLNACSLTVENNAVVVIPSGFDVNLYGVLSVVSGSFTLENNANLIQTSNAANSGNIIVKRNSSALKRLDYTLWSSPVAAQNMLAFSPLTSVTPSSRFYSYNVLTHEYNSIASPSTTLFTPTNAYLIRMPNNHPTTPTIWNGQFGGVPNNGDYTYTIAAGGTGQHINLVGNPYPSPISAAAFVADNSASITGTLYFWRKTNSASVPSYCTWTALGGFVTNGEAEVYDPQGIIQTGQGFLIEGTAPQNIVTFKNSQRSGNNAGQFFRTANEVEKHRIWLNVTGTDGAFAQTLVGYFTGATLEADQNIDGRNINGGPVVLTTLINGTDYIIQGRPLPFDSADVVPLNFTAAAAGTYTIAIDHADGIFAEGQTVYLRDLATGVEHQLNNGGYTFTSAAGTFSNRFEVFYENSLGTNIPDPGFSTVAVVAKDGTFTVISDKTWIQKVQIFDIRGRLLAEKNQINSGETTLALDIAQQVVIVKITSVDQQTAVRKVISN
ncbi:MAG TPA: hypothetical protein VF676_09970 [Flavobacterium sp.]